VAVARGAERLGHLEADAATEAGAGERKLGHRLSLVVTTRVAEQRDTAPVSDEARTKRDAMLAAAEARGRKTLVASSPATVRWLLCGRGRPVSITAPEAGYTLVLDGERALALFPDIELSRAHGEERLEELGYELVPYPWHEGPARTLAGLVDGGASTTDADLEDAIAPLRLRLTEQERARYRAAATDAADAFAAALPGLAPEQTEYEAAAVLEPELRRRGFVAPVLLVGGETRQPVHRHPIVTGTRLGAHALLAATAERDGLHVSLTRLVSFGPPPAALAELARLTAEVDARMLAASRPGTTTGGVLEVAAAAYAELGYPEEWRKHHQGGLTGYKGREVFAVPGEPTELVDSCAVAWNPSITGGGKSEDTCLVTAEGVEVLTRTASLGELETSGLPRPAIVEL